MRSLFVRYHREDNAPTSASSVQVIANDATAHTPTTPPPSTRTEIYSFSGNHHTPINLPLATPHNPQRLVPTPGSKQISGSAWGKSHSAIDCNGRLRDRGVLGLLGRFRKNLGAGGRKGHRG